MKTEYRENNIARNVQFGNAKLSLKIKTPWESELPSQKYY